MTEDHPNPQYQLPPFEGVHPFLPSDAMELHSFLIGYFEGKEITKQASSVLDRGLYAVRKMAALSKIELDRAAMEADNT